MIPVRRSVLRTYLVGFWGQRLRGHTKRREKKQQRRDNDVGRVLLVKGTHGAEGEAEGFLEAGEEDGEGEPLPVLESVVVMGGRGGP